MLFKDIEANYHTQSCGIKTSLATAALINIKLVDLKSCLLLMYLTLGLLLYHLLVTLEEVAVVSSSL